MRKLFFCCMLLVFASWQIAGCRHKEKDVSDMVLFGTEEDTQEDDTTEEASLVVYVCGCVVRPGVYFLKPGDRICTAIEAAGGMAVDASVDYWNLAQLVEDGMKIYVPSVTQVDEGNFSSELNKLEQDGKININTADRAALMTLPSIGGTRADQIIKYREEHGRFHAIDEIKNVSGIKESVYSSIEEYITVND